MCEDREKPAPWYDRLEQLRRGALLAIGPASLVVILSALVMAALLCGVTLVLINVAVAASADDGWYVVSLLQLPEAMVARYPQPVRILCCAYLLWASHRISWGITRRRIIRQVRMVTCMFHHSDLLLQIVDPLYGLEPEPPVRQKPWHNPRRIRRFDDLLRTATTNLEKRWDRARKDAVALHRVNLVIQPTDLSFSCVPCSVFFVLVLLCVVFPMTGLLFPLVVLLAVVTWTGNYVLRRAALVAICDFVAENHGAVEYRGWSMPVRVPE